MYHVEHSKLVRSVFSHLSEARRVGTHPRQPTAFFVTGPPLHQHPRRHASQERAGAALFLCSLRQDGRTQKPADVLGARCPALRVLLRRCRRPLTTSSSSSHTTTLSAEPGAGGAPVGLGGCGCCDVDRIADGCSRSSLMSSCQVRRCCRMASRGQSSAPSSRRRRSLQAAAPSPSPEQATQGASISFMSPISQTRRTAARQITCRMRHKCRACSMISLTFALASLTDRSVGPSMSRYSLRSPGGGCCRSEKGPKKERFVSPQVRSRTTPTPLSCLSLNHDRHRRAPHQARRGGGRAFLRGCGAPSQGRGRCPWS